jgi:hypothetical protein
MEGLDAELLESVEEVRGRRGAGNDGFDWARKLACVCVVYDADLGWNDLR